MRQKQHKSCVGALHYDTPAINSIVRYLQEHESIHALELSQSSDGPARAIARTRLETVQGALLWIAHNIGAPETNVREVTQARPPRRAIG